MNKAFKTELRSFFKDYRRTIISSYCLPARSNKAKNVYDPYAIKILKKVDRILKELK